MAGEDEDGMVKGRIVSPPALPRLVPRSRTAAEHVPAHDGRAGAAEDVLGERRARVDLAAFLAVALAERLERDQPVVQLLTADPERTLWRLARAGDKAVDRHRDVQLQLAHRSSLCRHARRTAQRVRRHRSSQQLDKAGVYQRADAFLFGRRTCASSADGDPPMGARSRRHGEDVAAWAEADRAASRLREDELRVDHARRRVRHLQREEAADHEPAGRLPLQRRRVRKADGRQRPVAQTFEAAAVVARSRGRHEDRRHRNGRDHRPRAPHAPDYSRFPEAALIALPKAREHGLSFSRVVRSRIAYRQRRLPTSVLERVILSPAGPPQNAFCLAWGGYQANHGQWTFEPLNAKATRTISGICEVEESGVERGLAFPSFLL